MRVVAATGVAFLVAAIVGLVLWERAPYSTESSPFDDTVWYGYNPPGIQGIIIFLSCATASVMLLFETLDIYLHRAWTSGNLQSKKLSLIAHTICGFVFLALSVAVLIAWASPLLTCGIVFCVDPSVYNNWPSIRGDSFNGCIALAVAIPLITMGILFLVRSLEWRRQFLHDKQIPSAVSSPGSHVRLFTLTARRPLIKLASTFIVLVALFVVCGYLPNDARRWTPAFMAGYASLEAGSTEPGYSFVYPELPSAWFRSMNVHMGHGWVIKIYPSNVIFYVSLALLFAALCVIQLSPRLRFYSHIRVRRIPQFTFGDITILCSCVVVFALFFFYWIHDHNFKGLWSPATPEGQMHLSERWGRALGQLAVIVFSFLMIPAPRYSIVYSVVGISRESLLWLHRWFGYAMLAITFGHIVAYLVYFYEVGTLWHNLFHLPTLIGAVRNDFTVALITWATFVMFVSMGLLALNAIRRAFYEVFYYAHLISSYLMIPALLWHAHSAWMYMMPAVALWFLDQMLRIRQRAGCATIVSARAVGNDVVELVCDVANNQQLSVVYPGQYVYVNVPEISILQWHPFTLTSVATTEAVSGPLVMHIRSMGEETWTGALYRIVNENQPFTVRLEGPCGVPLDFSQYEQICLIGGGIGVVPCASIFGSLRVAHATDSGKRYTSQHVQVLWATRSATLAGAMRNYMDLPTSWAELDGPGAGATASHPSAVNAPLAPLDNEQACRFRCDLFVTKQDEFDRFRRSESIPSQRKAAQQSLQELSPCETVSAAAVWCEGENNDTGCQNCLSFEKHVSVHCHRPDLLAEITSFFSNYNFNAVSNYIDTPHNTGDNIKKLLFVCGPEALVDAVCRIGAQLGIPVHQEEFLF